MTLTLTVVGNNATGSANNSGYYCYNSGCAKLDGDDDSGTVSGSVNVNTMDLTFNFTVTDGSCAGNSGAVALVGTNTGFFLTGNFNSPETSFMLASSSATAVFSAVNAAGKWLQNHLVGEPVDTENGAHVMQHSLLKIHGAQELAFSISYNSLCLSNDLLGVGWSHNFEARLQQVSNSSIQVLWNANKSNLFTNQPGITNLFYCSDLPVVYDLLTRNTNGSYTLKEPTQRQWQFDNHGRLSDVINPHGQAVQLAYQSTNSYPTQIVESVSGKAFSLSYNASNLLATVSDGLGRAVALSYDSSNHLTQFVKSLGAVHQTNSFSYDAFGRVLTETNPEGIRVFANTYDSQGRVQAQKDAIPGSQATVFCYNENQTNKLITTVFDRTGAPTSYIYNQNYLLLSTIDALGNTNNYGYDTNGNQIAITNALGQIQRFAYDNFGNRISETDALGYTTTYKFDSRNNLTNIINALTNVAFFSFDTNNNLLASVDYITNQVLFSYDTNSMLRQTTSARGGLTTFTDTSGLITSITDAVTNTTRLAYDAVGRLVAVTNADGFVSTNGYDLNDNLTIASDGLRNKWIYSYDSAGRKLAQVDPLGNVKLFNYNGNGDLTNSVDAMGNNTFYGYDGEDRLTSITDPNGNTREIAYDTDGRIVLTTDALNHTNAFQYDAGGNLIAIVDALGITNQITTYDLRNQPVMTQDALGHQARMAYDPLLRLQQTVDPLLRTNLLSYDPLSRLIKSTDPLGLVSQQQFDSDGNRTAVINPKSAQTTFRYDLANHLLNSTNADSKATSYAFDGRYFITNIFQPSGAQTRLAYDAAGRLTNSQDLVGIDICGYDGKGRLLSLSENGKTIIYKYDALDRITNYTDAAGNVLQYAYDPVGNLTSLTYPNGFAVVYAYDAVNRLVTVKDWNGRTTAYGYDADDRILNITNQNGTIVRRSYDAAGRLFSQADMASSTNVITQVFYVYDAAGQITSEVKQPTAAVFQPTAVSMIFDPNNALTNYAALTVANDLNGNMTDGPLTNGIGNYVYDARNRLTSAGGLTNAYDPAGNRVAMTNGTTVAQFVVNPNASLSEVLVRIKNSVTNYYVYGAGLLYEITSTSNTNRVLTYHSDYRGSTVAITDVNGNVTDRVSYSPYCGITSRSGTNDTPFLFSGRYGVITDLNGLLHMRARFFNSLTCRFLNVDPSGISSGPNYYMFANENPISNIDPRGLTPSVVELKTALSRMNNVIALQVNLIHELNADVRSLQNPQNAALAKDGLDFILSFPLPAKIDEAYAWGKPIGDSLQGVGTSDNWLNYGPGLIESSFEAANFIPRGTGLVTTLISGGLTQWQYYSAIETINSMTGDAVDKLENLSMKRLDLQMQLSEALSHQAGNSPDPMADLVDDTVEWANQRPCQSK